MSEEPMDLDAIIEGEFSMGDDGELQVSTEALQAADEPAGEPETQDPAPAPVHDWEERYRNLEPEFTRRSQELAELKRDIVPGLQQQLAHMQGQMDALLAGRGPAPEDDERMAIPENLGEILMHDPSQGAAIIAEISDRVAEKRLGPILERVAPMLEDWELETELRNASLKPGREDFFELLPTIRDIIVRSEEDISFDSAYQLAKQFKGVDKLAQAQTSETPAQSQPATTERISPEEAQQIAARLKPDTGVSGEVQAEQRVASSVEDAFNMAVEEYLGS